MLIWFTEPLLLLFLVGIPHCSVALPLLAFDSENAFVYVNVGGVF